MSNCNEQPDTYAVQLINAREVPVWEQATLPTETYIHASIKQYPPPTAADELTRYNIPVQDLLGLKTSADATVPKNGSEIKPVARQFVAAYISKNQPHAVTQGDGDLDSTLRTLVSMCSLRDMTTMLSVANTI